MNQIPRLSKFIQYMIGRHPDEFGLIADENGFVKIKSLLQALHEEPHWKFVRRSHFNELLLICRPAPIEIQDNLIRVVDRRQISPTQIISTTLPKLLYTAIRQRTHSTITTNGIRPNTGLPYVVLTRDKEMALRMGRRIDNHPVIIIVKVNEADTAGVIFRSYGEHLFLTDYLPPAVVICPPLPKDTTSDLKSEKSKSPAKEKMPGSFIWQPDTIDTQPTTGDKSKRPSSTEWKKQRRLARKHKKKVQNSDFM